MPTRCSENVRLVCNPEPEGGGSAFLGTPETVRTAPRGTFGSPRPVRQSWPTFKNRAGKAVMNVAHKKTTSKKVAKKASSLLRGKRTPAKVKSVAGSALAQKHGGRRKSK